MKRAMSKRIIRKGMSVNAKFHVTLFKISNRHVKRIILNIAFLLIGIIQVNAQQYPLNTNYVFNNFGINPAFAGSEDCIDFKAGYRLSWVGFERTARFGSKLMH